MGDRGQHSVANAWMEDEGAHGGGVYLLHVVCVPRPPCEESRKNQGVHVATTRTGDDAESRHEQAAAVGRVRKIPNDREHFEGITGSPDEQSCRPKGGILEEKQSTRAPTAPPSARLSVTLEIQSPP
jgi:hypothetical protein